MTNEAQELIFRYGIVLRRYNEAYAEKRQIEDEIKSMAERWQQECGRTGKTIDELER